MNISGGTAFPPRHTATQAGFPRQYFPFLKAGEFILPRSTKKRAHTLLQGRVLIYHLIRVNFRMEVLKAFNEPQPLRPAMSKAKRGISCGQGNTVSSHLPPQRSAARFPADRAGGKPEKGFKTGMLLQDSRKWCTPEEEYTIPDAVSGKCTTSGVRRVPTSR